TGALGKGWRGEPGDGAGVAHGFACCARICHSPARLTPAHGFSRPVVTSGARLVRTGARITVRCAGSIDSECSPWVGDRCPRRMPITVARRERCCASAGYGRTTRARARAHPLSGGTAFLPGPTAFPPDP